MKVTAERESYETSQALRHLCRATTVGRTQLMRAKLPCVLSVASANGCRMSMSSCNIDSSLDDKIRLLWSVCCNRVVILSESKPAAASNWCSRLFHLVELATGTERPLPNTSSKLLLNNGLWWCTSVARAEHFDNTVDEVQAASPSLTTSWREWAKQATRSIVLQSRTASTSDWSSSGKSCHNVSSSTGSGFSVFVLTNAAVSSSFMSASTYCFRHVTGIITYNGWNLILHAMPG